MPPVLNIVEPAIYCYKHGVRADLQLVTVRLAPIPATILGDATQMHCGERLIWLLVMGSFFAGAAEQARIPSTEDPAVPTAVTPGLRALASALGPFRPFEARLSGGFEYAPYRSDAGSTQLKFQQFLNPQFQARLAAEALIHQEAEVSRSPASIGALGVLLLIQGRFEDAVAKLELACRQAPLDPRLKGDLAVAYAVAGEAGVDPLGLLKAAEIVEESARNGSLSPEMAFNQVLFLNKWYLREDSRELWKEFCADSSNLEWCGEAPGLPKGDSPAIAAEEMNVKALLIRATRQGHRAGLEPLVREFPQMARELGENELLSQWADAFLDAGETASPLDAAGAIGAALRRANGERLLAQSVDVITHAGPETKRALALGHRSFSRGLALLARSDAPAARHAFSEAFRLLDRGGSPMKHWASLQLAICLYYLAEYDNSRQRLRALLQAGSEYRSLVGRVNWMLGLIQIDTGDRSASLESYRRALGIFERLNEASNVFAVHNLLANNYRFMGAEGPAWRHQRQALAGLHRCPLTRRYQILIETAVGLLQEGQVHLAVRFQDKAIQVAKAIGEPSRLAEAQWWKARIDWKLGAVDQAQSDLTAAIETAKKTPPGVREREQADIWMTQGEMLAESDPTRAIETIGQALEYYSSRGYQVYVSRLRLARYRALRKLGRIEEARADLAGAVEQAERQREPARGSVYDWDELDQLRPVYDELVAFEHGFLKDDLAALESSERGRARRLAETLGEKWSRQGDSVASPSVAEVASKLPPATALVYFHVLPERLLIGLLHGGGGEIRESGVGERELNALVEGLGDDLAMGRNSRHLGSLFDLLLRPVWDSIQDSDTLVIVPDKALNSVPFAALVDVRSGSYLVEKKTLIFAPSATAYWRALHQERERRSAPVNYLLVGSGAGRGQEGLPELREVGREINQIAQTHANARVSILMGNSATKAKFLEEVAHATHLHFAGHALGNPRHPDFSRLLMAPQENDSGSLYSSDISNRDWPDLRLVVLAACQTGSGPVHRGEGILSLARPFLAAGVPAVVSTLWEVDDATAASFFPRFHSLLATGQDPFSALRAAQLEVVRGLSPLDSHPKNWAGFQAWGGGNPQPR